MRTLTILVICCLLFSACQKEISPDVPASANSACKACSYYPVCNGSIYNYVDSTSGIANAVTENIVIIKDTTFDGKVFQQVNSGGLTSFYNCTAGETRVVIFNLMTSVGLVPKISITPIKSNQAVGAVWSDTLSNGLGQRVEYDYTMAAKGLTKTLLGVTYNDVMQINLVVTLSEPGFPTVVAATSEYYYANNIGIIEAITYSDAIFGPPTVIYHRVLKTYSIP